MKTRRQFSRDIIGMITDIWPIKSSDGGFVMQCPKCQHENRDGAILCEECGTKLQIVCTECGNELRPQ